MRAIVSLVAVALGLLSVSSAVAADANTLAAVGLKMRFVDPGQSFYPDSARVRNVQGRVLLGFTIDATGSPQNVEVVRSDETLLDAAATRLLRDIRYELPPAWAGSVEATKRFGLQVTFALGQDAPMARWLEDVGEIVVRGTRIVQPQKSKPKQSRQSP
jgi:TonB family protein